MAPPVFKTGLAANIVAGGFDSLPPPPVTFSSATDALWAARFVRPAKSSRLLEISSSDCDLVAAEAGEGEAGVVLVIKVRLVS